MSVICIVSEKFDFFYAEEPCGALEGEMEGYLSLDHGVQRRMISVNNFFVCLRLLFFALLLLYET